VNPQCSSEGRCECLNTIDGGSFVGAHCDMCKKFLWGPACNFPCPCNKHGTCDRETGECACFADAVQGYWGGANCEWCAAGFIGMDCLDVDLQMSLSDDASHSFKVNVLEQAINVDIPDPPYHVRYTGSRPLLLEDMRTGKLWEEAFDFGGSVMSATFSNDNVTFTLIKLDGQSPEVFAKVTCSRGYPMKKRKIVYTLPPTMSDGSAFNYSKYVLTN